MNTYYAPRRFKKCAQMRCEMPAVSCGWCLDCHVVGGDLKMCDYETVAPRRAVTK